MNKKFLLLGASAAIMLAACGDENTTNVTELVGPKTLAKGEALNDYGCGKDNAGEFVFVTDSSEAYYCNGKDWQTLKGEDGEKGTSCTAKKNSDGDFDLTCGDKKVGTIKNGENGKEGTSCTAKKNSKGNFDLTCDGKKVGTIENGESGASCTAKKNSDGNFDLTCGGEKVGTIKNGEPGAKGDGCKVDEGENGVVTITCGEGDDATTTQVFKAMCGGVPYDPAERTCIDNEFVKPCGKDFYKIKSQYCQKDKVINAICGDDPYNPLEKYCHNGNIEDHPKCNGVSYFPETQYCLKNKEVKDYGYYLETEYISHPIYKTVEIDGLEWFAENLARGTKSSYCGGGLEGDSKEGGNCEVYGRLYTWEAANNACPRGWRLPSKADFDALFKSVGGIDKAGKALKSTDGWNGNGGDDSYGFSALPAGYLDPSKESNPYLHTNRDYADFWTSTTNGTLNKAWKVLLRSDSGSYFNNDEKAEWEEKEVSLAFSVRCVRDVQ